MSKNIELGTLYDFPIVLEDVPADLVDTVEMRAKIYLKNAKQALLEKDKSFVYDELILK